MTTTYYAFVNAGIDNDGDPNWYDLAIKAPDEETALAVVAAYGADTDGRITDIEDPEFWELKNLTTVQPLTGKHNWNHLIAGAEPGSYTYDES